MGSLKVIVGDLLMPLPVGFLLGCCALLAHRLRRPRMAIRLASVAAAVWLLSAFGPVANALLLPLEDQYPATLDATALRPAPRYIVVLGSGYHPRPGLPVTSSLDLVGVARLTEGVRLWRQLPGATLVLSGGRIRGEPAIAGGYALAAAALGVPSSGMLLLDDATDTGTEIRALHGKVGDAPVLLVTSASHMPRAMALAATLGVHARAAPTANLVDPTTRPFDSIALPSGTSLRKTETALHEYLGLLALRLGVV